MKATNNQNQEIKVVVKRWYYADTMGGKEIRLVLAFTKDGEELFTIARSFDSYDANAYEMSSVIGKEVKIKLEQVHDTKYEVINLEHFVKNNNLKRRQSKMSQKDILALFY